MTTNTLKATPTMNTNVSVSQAHDAPSFMGDCISLLVRKRDEFSYNERWIKRPSLNCYVPSPTPILDEDAHEYCNAI